MYENEIVQGDACQTLSEMPDESVHLIVTSPPYWQIKDYEVDGQTGYGQTLDEYIADLTDVWKECHRVLSPGCRLVVIVGDQYVSGGEIDDKPYHIIPISSLVQSRIHTTTEFLNVGPIIWRKVSNQSTSGGASVMGSYGQPRNGYATLEHEHIHIFKKEGSTPKPDLTDEQKEAADLREDWRELFTDHWNVPGEQSDRVDHPAPFPEEIAERLIRMFSWPTDLVVDPYVGSGTVPVVARELERRFVGIDISEEYVQSARNRLRATAPKMSITDW